MSNALHRSLETLFRELIDGPNANAAWMLDRGDVGLLRSLDKLTASSASAALAAGVRGRGRNLARDTSRAARVLREGVE